MPRDRTPATDRRHSPSGTVALLLAVALCSLSAPTPVAIAQPAASATPAAAFAPPAQGDPFYDTFGGLRFDSRLPSPRQFLGHDIGERFTRYPDAVAYLRHLADHSDRVQMEEYGRTHQRRPLHILTISSPANLARLDDILARNAALADPRNTTEAAARDVIASNPAVVWLSFNVHGNEASCTETALQLVYTLAAASNQEVRDLLESLIIVIDPCINPDGRERYVSWFDNTVGAEPTPDPASAEHDEPWPGGRTNHYLFDLNRDWLWGVHPESRARVAVYRRYLPQLHVDYHEQEPSSPYFFGAGEKPYNRNIPDETKDWINRYGESNAAAFDSRALPYSTRERFDYLYPGYGKVLPTYHGAVGLLCEKGGHGRAGLTIDVDDRTTVTLRRRASDHFVTAIDYLVFTAANRSEQLERFRRFFQSGLASPRSDAPAAYLIAADNDPALLKKVWDVCAMHDVEIYRAVNLAGSTVGEIPITDYWSNAEVERPRSHLWEGAWIIPAAQPRAALVHALFERATFVEEKETYDITGWSLPLAFGLRAWMVAAPIDRLAIERVAAWSPEPAILTGEGGVAVLVSSAHHAFPRAVAALTTHDLAARCAAEPIVLADGAAFPAGSLILHAEPNDAAPLSAFVRECLDAGIPVHRTASALTNSGPVLGANAHRRIPRPRVAILRGEPISSYSFGQVWHALDIESPTTHAAINLDALSRADLSEYTAIIIPDAGARLARALDASAPKLRDFVRAGGAVVALGGSSQWVETNILEIKDEKKEETDEDRPPLSELTWQERDERADDDNVPGPMMKAAVDRTHPLAVGVGPLLAVIKQSDHTLRLKDDGAAVARFDSADPFIGGMISQRNIDAAKGKPFVTHHQLGSGAVICFSDDITIRGFMHAPLRLFLNAVTLGPSL